MLVNNKSKIVSWKIDIYVRKSYNMYIKCGKHFLQMSPETIIIERRKRYEEKNQRKDDRDKLSGAFKPEVNTCTMYFSDFNSNRNENQC